MQKFATLQKQNQLTDKAEMPRMLKNRKQRYTIAIIYKTTQQRHIYSGL